MFLVSENPVGAQTDDQSLNRTDSFFQISMFQVLRGKKSQITDMSSDTEFAAAVMKTKVSYVDEKLALQT